MKILNILVLVSIASLSLGELCTAGGLTGPVSQLPNVVKIQGHPTKGIVKEIKVSTVVQE